MAPAIALLAALALGGAPGGPPGAGAGGPPASASSAAPSPASSTPSAPIIITAPKAKATPDADLDVDEENISEKYGPIWPSKAYDRRIGGKAVLTCRIDVHGLARACVVASESPRDLGFGAAALQLQPSLKLRPPPEGQTSIVRTVSVSFDLPADTLAGSGSGESPGTGYSTAGSGFSKSGNPMIMKPVTMMSHPLWATAPAFDDMRRAYPAHAGGVEGFVVLRCEVTRTGGLNRCDVSKETPDRRGFALAALSLAPLFKVTAEVMARAPSGAPIQLVVPIRFPAPGAASRVTAPLWISGFDPGAAPRLFPPEAVAQGLKEGRGVARCRVGDDGVLTACVPQKADPEGFGFSEAAVVLASTLKMNLWSADAGPVRGGVVQIPFQLTLAAAPAAAAGETPPAPPSP